MMTPAAPVSATSPTSSIEPMPPEATTFSASIAIIRRAREVGSGQRSIAPDIGVDDGVDSRIDQVAGPLQWPDMPDCASQPSVGEPPIARVQSGRDLARNASAISRLLRVGDDCRAEDDPVDAEIEQSLLRCSSDRMPPPTWMLADTADRMRSIASRLLGSPFGRRRGRRHGCASRPRLPAPGRIDRILIEDGFAIEIALDQPDALARRECRWPGR